jgi:aspartate carbamoyltransferase regulatory subunit
MKQLKVDAIKNGTVIDHIPGGKGMRVADLIHIEGENVAMIGISLNSKKVGKKDIIKIESRELKEEEINSIALIAPSATITIIKDFEVVRKVTAHIPETIVGMIRCPNPKCITNSEIIDSNFKLTDKEPLRVRCYYCEKKYSIEEVKIKI